MWSRFFLSSWKEPNLPTTFDFEVSNLKSYENKFCCFKATLFCGTWYFIIATLGNYYTEKPSVFSLAFFPSITLKNITIKFIKRNLTYLLWVPSWRMRSERLPRLSTFFTVIRFLTSVNSLMTSKVWPLLKAFPHSLHSYGFSPVWILWLNKFTELWIKAFPHSLHS